MSWNGPKKGYAKRGIASVEQGTSRWVETRRFHVEGVYARSGRNFSPDWMYRASWGQIEAWAGRNKLPRVHFRCMWGELMSEHRRDVSEEITTPKCRTIKHAQYKRLCAEWNSAGGAVTTASREFGLDLRFPNSRHGRVTKQLCRRYTSEYAPYSG